ncbi:hypothetical protein Gorai_007999, partial [Gossypium raimondii]|nr:hypothetical protein [Gossypium raimondii]
YDIETFYFDHGVRNAKRKQLESKSLDFVHPAYLNLLGHFRFKALEDFKSRLEQMLNIGEGFAASICTSTESCMLEFDQGYAVHFFLIDAAIKQANWDASKVKEKLCRDINAHALSVQDAKLSELVVSYEKQLGQSLSEPVESLFDNAGRDTWASIRKLLTRETGIAVSEFSAAISSFEFSAVFSHDNDSMPRVWTGKEDIKTITKGARTASLSLLSVMVAIRLDGKPGEIENILFSSLMEGTVTAVSSVDRSITTSDPLASSSWEEVMVSPKSILITPVQCKSLWRQFKAETEYTVTQAISAQEAYKQSNNWLPPPWAIVAMVVLGFNEFMLLLRPWLLAGAGVSSLWGLPCSKAVGEPTGQDLRNPLYLMGLFVVYLLSKVMWVQMDIPGQFQHGTLAGQISISSRFLPTIMNLLRRLAEEAQGHQTDEPPRQQCSLVFQS